MIFHPTLFGRTVRAFALGLPGIIVLPFVFEPPPGMPRLALAANPLILLTVMALAGAWAAPRAGLASAVVLGSRVAGSGLFRVAAIGTAAGSTLAAVDAILLRGAAPGLPSLLDEMTPSRLLLGVLYGGMTEEILMRWGLMSLLLLGLGRLLPLEVASWMSVLIAALAFALAHLPAVLMSGAEITPELLVRTVGWNTALGILFGGLFLRRGLEAAMLAHGGFHVGVVALALVV